MFAIMVIVAIVTVAIVGFTAYIVPTIMERREWNRRAEASHQAMSAEFVASIRR